jgi:hypothetical protein
MPRKTVILKKPVESVPSSGTSDKDKISRPDAEALAASEEIRADEKKDGQDKPEPGKGPDNRPRCEHGRLFKCQQCEANKGKRTPEEEARRREKLEQVVGQFYESTFNIVALIAGDETFRLKKEERHGLSTTGASTVEEVAPEVSLKVIAVIAHAVTLGGIVTGKVWDSQKKKPKDAEFTVKDGKPDAERPSLDLGDKANGKDDTRQGILRIP